MQCSACECHLLLLFCYVLETFNEEAVGSIGLYHPLDDYYQSQVWVAAFLKNEILQREEGTTIYLG